MTLAAASSPSSSPSPIAPSATPHIPADFFHTKRRLRERYGLRLELYQIARLSRAIARSDPSCVVLQYEPRPDPGRLLVAMPVEGRWVVFVWDLGSKRVVTALPEHYLEPWADVLDGVTAGMARAGGTGGNDGGGGVAEIGADTADENNDRVLRLDY